MENETGEEYGPGLAAGDKLIAYQTLDADGILRWLGTPLSPSVRKAITTEVAGDEKFIYCNLYNEDGVTEITSGLGSEIKVYCSITRDVDLTEYDLVWASPKMLSGDILFVVNIAGIWHAAQVFQCFAYCACTTS
jgi:hypothetical protein